MTLLTTSLQKRQYAILMDWRGNRISSCDAIARLVHECGMSTERAAALVNRS